MSTWTLRPATARTAEHWPLLVDVLDGMQTAWADLDGIHVGVPAPTAPPLTSHLWAWGPQRWIRVRVDGDRWWAGGLHHGEPGPSELWRREEPVAEVITDVIRSWSLTDGRIRQLRVAEGVVPERMLQLVPVRPTTAVYIGSVDSMPGVT